LAPVPLVENFSIWAQVAGSWYSSREFKIQDSRFKIHLGTSSWLMVLFSTVPTRDEIANTPHIIQLRVMARVRVRIAQNKRRDCRHTSRISRLEA